MWKEAVAICSDVLSLHSSWETEENHEYLVRWIPNTISALVCKMIGAIPPILYAAEFAMFWYKNGLTHSESARLKFRLETAIAAMF
jgi:hypothetical protein